MPRVKLTLEYDGSNYVGWQAQLNGPSIQTEVEKALAKLLRYPVSVTAAGRTDSGVHAMGQVVAFDVAALLPLKAYRMGLNSLLPMDISVVHAEEVDASFDPRRWSRGKRYKYLVSNRRNRSPLRRKTHWEVFSPLDVGAMQQAAQVLVGAHDFSAFRASDCQASHARRTIHRLAIEGVSGDVVSFTLEGTAFLKHMVRNIVGTLVEVGRSRQSVAWVDEVLRGKDRTRAGPTAPPHGLCLEAVFYSTAPAEEDDGE